MSKQNQWEVWHDTNWTEFETHSLVFGILRKYLKGKYLVRGEYVFLTKEGQQFRPDISIFQMTTLGKPAELKLTIEVKRDGNTIPSKQQQEKYESLGVPCLIVTGKEGTQILERVSEYLPI